MSFGGGPQVGRGCGENHGPGVTHQTTALWEGPQLVSVVFQLLDPHAARFVNAAKPQEFMSATASPVGSRKRAKRFKSGLRYLRERH